jgi:HK97 family phage major capsid protein
MELKELTKSVKEAVGSVGGLQQKQKEHDTALDQIKSDVDELIKRSSKIGSVQTAGNQNAVDTKGFEQFLRKGDKEGLQSKGMETGVDADGGYTVIPHLDSTLIGTIAEVNPILRDVRRNTIGSNTYQQLFTVSGAVSGRVAEKGARGETATPQYARPEVGLTMQFAYPKVTEELALSSNFNIAQHVQREVVTAFDTDWEAEMLTGDGVAPNQKGMLTAADSADTDDVRAFASYQLLTSAASGVLGYDDLVTLIHSLKPKYRKGAKFYASTSAVEAMRKLKDTNGMPLWRDADTTVTRPQGILGYEVVEAQMPAMAAGAKSLMFGDLAQAYTFVSHESGLQVLRDPYTEPSYIKYYSRLLCGSGPMDTRALKVMSIAA